MNRFDWSITRDQNFRQQLRVPPDDRDDALQQAFLKLRDHPDCTVQLLRKTAQNCYRDSVKADFRRRKREKGGLPAQYEDPCNAEPKPRKRGMKHDNAGQSYTHEPSANMERREMRAAVKRVIRDARLSRKHRCALWAWLRDRVADFATNRGVPQVTVRVWAHRALKALRPHLERAGFGAV